jgi:hypothetical protein
MKALNPSDTVVVTRLDRLARSSRELRWTPASNTRPDSADGFKKQELVIFMLPS